MTIVRTIPLEYRGYQAIMFLGYDLHDPKEPYFVSFYIPEESPLRKSDDLSLMGRILSNYWGQEHFPKVEDAYALTGGRRFVGQLSSFSREWTAAEIADYISGIAICWRSCVDATKLIGEHGRLILNQAAEIAFPPEVEADTSL